MNSTRLSNPYASAHHYLGLGGLAARSLYQSNHEKPFIFRLTWKTFGTLIRLNLKPCIRVSQKRSNSIFKNCLMLDYLVSWWSQWWSNECLLVSRYSVSVPLLSYKKSKICLARVEKNCSVLGLIELSLSCQTQTWTRYHANGSSLIKNPKEAIA